MAEGRDVNIVVRAVNATSAGFGSAVGGLNTLKQEVGKAAGAVNLLNKGLIAVGAVSGIAAALKDAFTGTGDASERILRGVQALPFGIGEAAKLGEQLYDMFSGAADEAERMAQAAREVQAIGRQDIQSTESAQRAEDELRLLNIKNPFDKIREDFAQKSAGVNREMDRKESEIGGPIESTARERAARLALLDKQRDDALAAERAKQLNEQKQRVKAAQDEAQKGVDSFFDGVKKFFGGAADKQEVMDRQKEQEGKMLERAQAAAENSRVVLGPRPDLEARDASLLRFAAGGNARPEEMAKETNTILKQTQQATISAVDLLRQLLDKMQPLNPVNPNVISY